MKKNTFKNRLISFICFLVISTSLGAQVWNREVIDSSGIHMGRFCSLEFDQEDNPHVVYMDGDFFDLKYAVKKDGQWQLKVLDELRYSGVSSDLAIDSENHPHVCFQEGCQMSALCPGSGLQYMFESSSGWIKETVDSFLVVTGNDDQTNCSIELNAFDQPVIAYKDFDTIKLAVKIDSLWQKIVCPYPGPAMNLNMVLTSNGDPVLQYFDNTTMILAKYNVQQKTWEKTTYNAGILLGLSYFGRLDIMDIDENNYLHIIYPTMSMMGMPTYRYLKYDWNSWTSNDFYDGFGPIKVFGSTPYFVNLNSSFSLFKRNSDQWEKDLIDEDASAVYASIDQNSADQFGIAVFGSNPDLSDNKTSLFYYSYQPGAPAFNASQSEIDFGEVWQQSYVDKSNYIKNSGVAPLVISIGEWEEENTHYKVLNAQKTIYVQPGDSMQLLIRFTPAGTGVYTDKLTLITNDKSHPVFKLSVVGSGIEAGASGILNLRVNDVILDTLNLHLNQNTALANVNVSILKNNLELITDLKSDVKGMVHCDLPVTGNIEIKIETTLILDDGEQIQIINKEYLETGPGANSHMMFCPYSLFELKYRLMDTLMHIEKATGYYGLDYYRYGIIETKIEKTVVEYANDFDPSKTDALARLMLVELMTRDLYGDGRKASTEMFKDFGELISFIIYMDDWTLDIVEILKSIIETAFSEIGGGAEGAKKLFEKLVELLEKKLIKDAIIEAIETAVDMIGSQLGDTPHMWLDDAWGELRDSYSSNDHFAFSIPGWGKTCDMAQKYLTDPFVQFVYIDLLTQPSLDDGFNFMLQNRYNGSFDNAYRRQVNCISEQKSMVEENVSKALDLRENANLWLVTAQMLDLVKTFIPSEYADIISFVDNLTGVMGMSAYVEVAIALGFSTSTFFLMPAHMDDDVKDIFNVNNEFKNAHFKTGIVNKEGLNGKSVAYENKLMYSEQAYDSVLLIIQTKMNAGERFEAVLELESLIEKEKAYKNQMRLLSATVYALACDATNDIDGFSESYETLLVEKANAEQERYVTYLRTFCLIADSMGLMNDTIHAQLQRTMDANHQYTEQIMELNAVIENNYDIPAIVLSSYRDQDENALALGDTGTVRLRFQNVGSKKTDQLFIKIDNNDALLHLGLDSIQIGELAPGEESQDIELKFLLQSNGFHQGLWTIGVHSDSAFTLSDKGYFEVIGNTVSRGEVSLEKTVMQCFPNPVDASARIEYNLEQATHVSIDLYDLLGRRVKTLFHGMKPGGHHQLIWEADNLPKGMYLLSLKEGKQIKESIKIIVH